MTKKTVNKYFNKYDVLDGKVAGVIENLKVILEEFPDAEIDISYDSVEICGKREETDEEYCHRLLKESAAEAHEREVRKRKYEELKKNFGDA